MNFTVTVKRSGFPSVAKDFTAEKTVREILTEMGIPTEGSQIRINNQNATLDDYVDSDSTIMLLKQIAGA